MDPRPAGLRLLVADDDANLRRILSLFLRSAGYEVEEAEDGRQAIEAARDRRPALALLDIMMPILDGFAACRILKEDPRTRDIPVVICSARSGNDDLAEALRLGAEDYIAKPFRKEAVLEKVARILATRGRADRRERRKPADWQLSWGGGSGLPGAVYRTRLLDLSSRGFAFEFVRCDLCTGYEPGTVHPLCLFAGHASRFEGAKALDFVLSARPDAVYRVQGRIAHVHQSADRPRTEKVGVVFTHVPAEARRAIHEYVDGAPGGGR
jgi:CheY-like chemotaxis protein